MALLSDFLDTDNILMSLKVKEKEEALNIMIGMLNRTGNILNQVKFEQEILAREQFFSTGIGFEIAIPHARIDEVKKFSVVMGIIPEGVDFNSIDGKPVKIIIMVASRDRDKDLYTKMVTNISLYLRSAENREKLVGANSAFEVLRLLRRFEQEPTEQT
ncbi:PTS sugar transporter subunit IIA [bacterium]|nr:PTS sugar transporter subunit IIA [bacterium]